jgi:hypothetical protein
MSSIGYVTIGAVDGEKSGAFYDAVFGALGIERKFESGGRLGYGAIGPGKSFVDCHTAVCPPYNGKEARATVLESSPLIGRPVENGKRELVIATGATGYLALYRFVPELDTVFVLGVRSQRELRFGKGR